MNSRRKRISILVIVALAVLGLYLSFQRVRSPSEPSNLRGKSGEPVTPVGTSTGQLAPDFQARTVDGNSIQLEDYRGQVVLLNLFASWCGPCLAETPHLVEAYTSSGQDFIIIGLNFQETSNAVNSYKQEFNVPYPLVLNPNGELSEVYQPIGLPTSWFIDQRGIIRYIHSGPMTADMIEIALRAAEAGEKPDFSQITG